MRLSTARSTFGRRTALACAGAAIASCAAFAASPAADRIIFFDDVDDNEKPYLMAGCASFVLPSKPRPEFVETFGIALVEKMLAGGGPVITTDTGGIGEAVGDTALIVPVESPGSIAGAPGSYTDDGPPERMMPTGSFAAISSAVAVCGTSSL